MGIDELMLFYMISVIGVAVYLRWLYIDIMRLRNPGKGLSFTHDDGTSFSPFPFFEEYGDTEEVKKLIKKRNRVSLLFCFMFVLLFVLGYFVSNR